MASKYCLLPKLANEVKLRLKNGEIDPQKLSSMSSEERNVFFSEFLGGENAKNVNALFESKLLLKNQQTGLINWAKQITGIKESVKQDIITKIMKMDKLLNPAEEKLFLKDLVATRLGTDVSLQEAKIISELSNNLIASKNALASGGDRIKYGADKVILQNYVKDLKLQASQLSPKEYAQPKNWLKAVSELAGLSKSLKATLDNSYIGRQGIKVLFSNPKIWAKNAVGSFDTIAKTIQNKKILGLDAADAVKAEIFSRENAINGLYDRLKLDIGNVEEAFPTSLPEKIPGIGRLFKASEAAYTATAYKMRADLADFYIKLAENLGVDLGNKVQAESLGKMINSMTGRGHLGKFENAAPVLNNLFFSAKFLKANIDTLLNPVSAATPFVRKESAKNLFKIIGGMAVTLGLADQLYPGSVEWDSRSSDFGKIKIGDTRFDITGGMGSLAVLASRIARKSTKSSVSGVVSKLGTGYGQKSINDLLSDFLSNKLSPSASFVKRLFEGQGFGGEPLTVGGELANLFAPLPITNFLETAQNPNSANLVLSAILDGLGISSNTFSATPKNIKDRIIYEGAQTFEKGGDSALQKYLDKVELKGTTAKKSEIKSGIISKIKFKAREEELGGYSALSSNEKKAQKIVEDADKQFINKILKSKNQTKDLKQKIKEQLQLTK